MPMFRTAPTMTRMTPRMIMCLRLPASPGSQSGAADGARVTEARDPSLVLPVSPRAGVASPDQEFGCPFGFWLSSSHVVASSGDSKTGTRRSIAVRANILRTAEPSPATIAIGTARSSPSPVRSCATWTTTRRPLESMNEQPLRSRTKGRRANTAPSRAGFNRSQVARSSSPKTATESASPSPSVVLITSKSTKLSFLPVEVGGSRRVTAGGMPAGAHIRVAITDLEIPSIEEAGELEDPSWLAVEPGEHQRLAPRPKLPREPDQSSDTGRVYEATVLEAEDNIALRALR